MTRGWIWLRLAGLAGMVSMVVGAWPEVFEEWRFETWNDRQGWEVPDAYVGTVAGGGLWLRIQAPAEQNGALTWQQFIWRPHAMAPLVSPVVAIDATRATRVCLRVLNLSPETDGLLTWRTAAEPERDAGPVRFTMRPRCDAWQDVAIDMSNRWSGTITQLRIVPALLGQCGDMWIARIAVEDGPSPAPAARRPDIASASAIPRITLPGIEQAAFADAFKVLDECVIVDVPVHGFNEPVMSPGGAYGANWWQLDSALTCDGAKWVDQSFAEGVLRGFAGVQAQNPDGRIDLWGGAPSRGMPAPTSSIPRLFEVAYRVARRSEDPAVHRNAFELSRKYLEWWLSPVKRDASTGLITSIFEESFDAPLDTSKATGVALPMDAPQTIAPVDLQVAVAIGCAYTAELAELNHEPDAAVRYRGAFEALKAAINVYCWDEEDGAYYSFNVKTMTRRKRLVVSTFDPLRLGIAPPERVERLLTKLTDPSLFHWGIRPLTSLAKTEPDYVEAVGPYDGRAWLGDVWTMRNVAVIFGLRDAGREDLAAQLAWDTVKMFNGNYAEYVVPSTGAGEGVARYGWSASQYIQTIIECVFGIEYDAAEKRLTIAPLRTPELRGARVAIEGLRLPLSGDARLSVSIEPDTNGQAVVSIAAEPALDDVGLRVVLDGATREMPLKAEQTVVFGR